MNNLEHFDRLFLLVAASLGLVMAGGVNLVVGTRTRRRIALSTVAGLVVCAGTGAALASLTRAGLGVRAAALMSGVVVAVALVAVVLRSARLHRRAAPLAVALWVLLALSGAVLATSAVVRFERDEAAVAEANTQAFESELVRYPTEQPTARARALTDRGTPITLKKPIPTTINLNKVEGRTLRDAKLTDQLIRHSTPTDVSNCHGWIFTGGRFLLYLEDVEIILRENGYVEMEEPQPGDLVIYRRGGSIIHSAIVRYVTEGQPVMIEGKWGALGVFLHSADKSVYGTEYTFHRSGRRGHLLVGLGGASPDPAVVTPAVTE